MRGQRVRGALNCADTDISALRALLGGRPVGAVTVGQALHLMRYREPIPALVPLLRPGGAIAVVTNGTPLWQQDNPWSRALHGSLEQWLGTTVTGTTVTGTDDTSQQNYRVALTEAGLDVTEARYEYADELDLDRLIGGICSALSVRRLPPPDQRAAFAAQIERAVAPYAPFTEHVPVRMLLGRLPQPSLNSRSQALHNPEPERTVAPARDTNHRDVPPAAATGPALT